MPKRYRVETVICSVCDTAFEVNASELEQGLDDFLFICPECADSEEKYMDEDEEEMVD